MFTWMVSVLWVAVGVTAGYLLHSMRLPLWLLAGIALAAVFGVYLEFGPLQLPLQTDDYPGLYLPGCAAVAGLTATILRLATGKFRPGKRMLPG